MEALRDVRRPSTGPGHVVTIGNYDGVHLGHRSVISLAKNRAQELGVSSAVVTFFPHPVAVLRPEVAPPLLTSLDRRLELLEGLGVDVTMVVPFDTERANELPEDFVRKVLVDTLEPKVVIVGNDFCFGKGRAGDVRLLTELGKKFGFEVIGHDLIDRPDIPDQVVSSSTIRRLLFDGDVTTAAVLLGQHHEVRGTVVRGDQRGRTIGFPTANIAVARELALPADGVYAAKYIRPDGTVYSAAVNIGKRPTFYAEAEHSVVEAHLLDFDDDLYGEPARLQFVQRLRGEHQFDGVDSLKAQLEQDRAAAIEVLG